MNQVGEPNLLIISWLVALDSVSTFYDEDVRVYRWHFGLDKMSVFFSRVVASVENLQTSDVDQEHTSPEDVPSMVGGKGNARTGCNDLVSRNGDDGRQRHRHLERGEKGV